MRGYYEKYFSKQIHFLHNPEKHFKNYNKIVKKEKVNIQLKDKPKTSIINRSDVKKIENYASVV